MSAKLIEGPADGPLDLDDPKLTTFDVVKEGIRREGIEIVHYEPQFPGPGTKREARLVRIVAGLFLFAGLLATAFVVAFIWWPWEYVPGRSQMKAYTPILGGTIGLSLFCIGLGVLVWGKKLLPHEIAIQDRHDGGSPPDERKITGETLKFIGAEMGLSRRPLLKVSLLGLAPLGLAAAAVPIGMLIKNPHPEGDRDQLFETGFNPRNNGGKPVRLVRDDMTAIRPEDLSVGGQITVFPGIPGGSTNQYADSPTLLIRLREGDATELRANLSHVPLNSLQNPSDPNSGVMYGDFVAYSKICTHAGCPASLYEQQTNRLLCPCHQSQFNILDNARPIFGPATRRLPALPIELDAEGYFVAKSDFQVAIGPAFWERP
jgi:ubiquinol-cytochrome c reductase iron-sulfur subunit